jgi:hypothetical protein
MCKFKEDAKVLSIAGSATVYQVTPCNIKIQISIIKYCAGQHSMQLVATFTTSEHYPVVKSRPYCHTQRSSVPGGFAWLASLIANLVENVEGVRRHSLLINTDTKDLAALGGLKLCSDEYGLA